VCNTSLRHLRIGDDNLLGIYGGQVISQAIMAATKTVDRAFHLHVSRTLSISESAVPTLTSSGSLCTCACSTIPLGQS
jgi:hypothetical protein